MAQKHAEFIITSHFSLTFCVYCYFHLKHLVLFFVAPPIDHVGVPLPCNFVKLVDVEDMNYFASNGEGEVGFLQFRQ